MKLLTLTLALFLTLFLTALQFTSSQYLPKNFIIATNEARKAAKVPLVKWNVTLAVYATKVARGCGRRPRTRRYGINIFVGSVNITASGCVGTWAGQRRCYNPKTRRCRRHCKCRGYRRMVSRRIKYMGCGRQTCSRKRECIVCAYWPHRPRMNMKEELDAPELSETSLYDEGADFDHEEEEYFDDAEEEHFDDAEEMEMNDVEEEEEYLNDAEEEELTAADEGEFSGAEYDTEDSSSGEKGEPEEATDDGLSSGLASKLSADWLWG